MLYAIKANRQYPIDETEKQKFINQGYKIAKLEDGNLIYEVEETEESKEIAELKVKINNLSIELEKAEEIEGIKLEELIKERTTLKGQLTKANNRIGELEKELEKAKGEGK